MKEKSSLFWIFVGIFVFYEIGTKIVPKLDQYFIPVIIGVLCIVLLMCIAAIIFVCTRIGNIKTFDKIFFAINLVVASAVAFPLFFLFFLELSSSYSMTNLIAIVLSLVESLIGLIIVIAIMGIYLLISIGLDLMIMHGGCQGLTKGILYSILTAANIVMVGYMYWLGLCVLAKYYVDADALEMYKSTFAPEVYRFVCFCKGLYEYMQ